MNCSFNKQDKEIRRYLPMLILVSFIGLLCACGINSDRGSTEDSGTTELSFTVLFNDGEQKRQRQAAMIDCNGHGIATVEAMVYDQDMNFLIGGGPWDCESGQETMDAVPAGRGRILAILAKDTDGKLLYRGQKTDVNIIASANNDAGTIACNEFTARPTAPDNYSLVHADNVELAWDTISGASDYRLVISENKDLSDPLIKASDKTGYYIPSNIEVGKTYHWQVVAVDAHDNEGIGSQILSFSAKNKKNMIRDPGFHLTQSDADARYWWLDNQGNVNLEWNTFDHHGQIHASGNPAIKITNRTDGGICYLWEKNPDPVELMVRTFPIQSNDKFYVQARVFESVDSDADRSSDFRAVIWAGDENRAWQSDNTVSLRPQAKGRWETVSGEISIYDRIPDSFDAWSPTGAYDEWDVVTHDTSGMGNLAIYRCLADGVSGADKEPPNSDYWVRYDNPRLGNFGIFSERCSMGYFLVDDVILSRVDSGVHDANLLADPTFSKTESNSDSRYWDQTTTAQWGPDYGYGSSSGIRFTLDGNEKWLIEMDGSGDYSKHPVEPEERLWIQFRVIRSVGADGGLLIGIRQWDTNHTHIGDTLTEVSTVAAENKWMVVTASITPSDANVMFCHLLVHVDAGTSGFIYIDDLVFSREEPII